MKIYPSHLEFCLHIEKRDTFSNQRQILVDYTGQYPTIVDNWTAAIGRWSVRFRDPNSALVVASRQVSGISGWLHDIRNIRETLFQRIVARMDALFLCRRPLHRQYCLYMQSRTIRTYLQINRHGQKELDSIRFVHNLLIRFELARLRCWLDFSGFWLVTSMWLVPISNQVRVVSYLKFRLL